MSRDNNKHTVTIKNELKRRSLARLSALTATALSVVLPKAFAQNKPASSLRIGFQKYGTLTLLKGTGALEKRLAPLGVEVRWTEFPAGPQLLEGLNVGSIDFGTTGEAPPIFAQAAGADLLYVGNEPPAPTAEAIIVPKNSILKTAADLKGKKIVLNKGSNVHYLLVKVLEKAGLNYKDVEVVFLPPADARAAFERGSVDAWAIWDPFLAAAEKQLGARVLVDGKGAVSNHQFYLAARSYAQKHADILRITLEELAKVDEWGAKNLKEVTTILAAQIGLDNSIVELSTTRFGFGVKPLTEQVIKEQQSIADTFAELKLIPRRINIRDAVLSIKS
ncbi:sulfonate ABC transporter substrate-binding protein [Undibacterium sp. TS12]|uniref:sulfonate ABC transporter substrate-binding protein n=1 Tax=Undibacterium sp. TS12 TaxID=2908202 RepID=UPI001F4C91E1|nr:sulfonate ABC transporter substrate-binding protein [Undibacterium sp. TS12]MCH8621334.1 sulfonate ABC transporter substrate-binding protein [Undibacterium sp. TS12]